MSKLFGWSEEWRMDSTGTKTFWLLFIPLYRKHFTHSTGLFE